MTPTQQAITEAAAAGREVCIAAAIRYKNVIWRGHRHGHCMEAMRGELSWNMTEKEIMQSQMFEEQGFVTNFNRYVSREEGREIHIALNIPSADPMGYRQKIMFSEDLY